MVERPIKKSERQAVTHPPGEQAHDQESVTQVGTQEKRLPPPIPKDRLSTQEQPKPDQEKRQGKAKGDRRREERTERAEPRNLALVRGPKPSRPKPQTEETPATEAEAAPEATPEAESEAESPESV